MTHMTNQIDEWIVARIWHRKPVGAEPKDVDVLVPKVKMQLYKK
jgi:hypothetical protein